MTEDASLPPRERILTAVLRLLDEGGTDAVSTRAVGAAADVQAPAIYRLFGDKQGLLEAAVERGYADWVARKGDRPLPADPVDALRTGWDEAIEFGVEHPAMYRIGVARTARSPALSAGHGLLLEKIQRVAAAGRLRVDEEQALALVQATARGVTLAVLDGSATSPSTHSLSTMAREAVIAAIVTDAPPDHDATLPSTAAALRTLLPRAEVLHANERALMDDWLARITAAPS